MAQRTDTDTDNFEIAGLSHYELMQERDRLLEIHDGFANCKPVNLEGLKVGSMLKAQCLRLMRPQLQKDIEKVELQTILEGREHIMSTMEHRNALALAVMHCINELSAKIVMVSVNGLVDMMVKNATLNRTEDFLTFREKMRVMASGHLANGSETLQKDFNIRLKDPFGKGKQELIVEFQQKSQRNIEGTEKLVEAAILDIESRMMAAPDRALGRSY